MIVERNIRLCIAFDGTDFNGWQRQKHDITIQGEIEKGLARMTNSDITLHGAGRTDAGVHAEGMVAHFTTTSTINCPAFHKGLNCILPPAIRILYVDDVPLEFHSRFWAQGKHYEYTIYTGKIMPPVRRLYALHAPYQLQFIEMKKCLELLVGTHDFSSFENSGSRDKTIASRKGAIRTICRAGIEHGDSDSDLHHFVIVGEGFLRHMVRNIVGTVLEVGRGSRTVKDFKQALLACDREIAGATAPAHGLTLKKVFYAAAAEISSL